MTQLEPATSRLDLEATDVGSVFVSNYPPYSFWSADGVAAAEAALDAPPREDTPLGLYLHVPFCRRRCKFCYFRVFTDKNAEQIESYVDALGTEVERFAQRRAVEGRPLHFVYFGGGTPSYIAVKQLLPLVERLKAAISWDRAEEVAFECEPGTLTQSKLEAIREIDVTRLSLGVENFDDEILRENGRAHVSTEIYRVWPWIRELGFPQVNVDLIAGMVGESWENWRECVEKTIELDPDSVTIYQMELPFNTVYSRGKLRGEDGLEFADWATKRAWHAYAFERLEEVGYERSSAYTVLKAGRGCRFVYRDSVWSGADMIGAGVSSFSHMSGVHFQNADGWNEYLEKIAAGGLAIARGFETSAGERLTREVILQLKTGHLEREPFERKFGVDPLAEFAPAFERLAERELVRLDDGRVELTDPGLLRVDQLLPEFYAPEYRDARYT
ncbi:MAG TPA: coproporphyrinogen-III oxidase family protein [Thermoanaerobaculia bacterium]|nr:coproporphyrinogen-III oxidase family protein [Thermoanaerobaculia bacterium]